MMKKLVFAIIAICAMQVSNAQVEQGNVLLSLGVGISPSFYSGGGYTSTTPPIEVAGEYAVTDAITAGLFAGYAGAEFRSGAFGFDYSYILGGAVGNYHFVNSEKFDAYGGVKLGYLSISADAVGTTNPAFTSEASGILYGGQLGARYWISEAIGLNVELGYGVATLRGGITFKL